MPSSEFEPSGIQDYCRRRALRMAHIEKGVVWLLVQTWMFLRMSHPFKLEYDWS